ncbi:PorV/PorQ family protein [Pedobacter sp. MR2016-19]|nr:PorV/PorQ family protein [Pedobacter sp. MR2016-19]
MNRLVFTFLIFLKNGKNIFLWAFLLVLTDWNTVCAQSVEKITIYGRHASNILTSVPFLLITPQARAGAMGNAGVAVEADANAPSLNMASMAYLKDGSYGFSVTYSPWLKNLTQGMSLSYLSGYYRIDERNTIAASLRFFYRRRKIY